MAVEAISAGLLGALVGSFLNVVIHRLPQGESIVSPRSRCPRCEAPITFRDNLPLISWLLLRGCCRHCGERISPRYPLVELLTALGFAAVVLARGVDAELALELPFAASLIVVAFVDLEHRIVPNRIVAPLAAWALVAGAAIDLDRMPEALLAGGVAFGFLLIAALAYPAGMGMGDVKLAGVMGLYLGAAVAAALFAAFLVGTLVGLLALAREGIEARRKGLPFAPFLALGGFVALLAGAELVDLYADRFLS